jgi:hypothetical protein
MLLQILYDLQFVRLEFEQFDLVLLRLERGLDGLEEDGDLGEERGAEGRVVQLQIEQTELGKVLWVLQLDLRVGVLGV